MVSVTVMVDQFMGDTASQLGAGDKLVRNIPGVYEIINIQQLLNLAEQDVKNNAD